MSVEKHFVMKQVSIFQCGADPKYTTIGSGSSSNYAVCLTFKMKKTVGKRHLLKLKKLLKSVV